MVLVQPWEWQYEYRVEFASPLAPLGMGRTHRVFLGKSVLQITEEVLFGSGLSSDDFESGSRAEGNVPDN